MKAKWFLLAGLSAMMLGACSSDDDLTNNPVDKPTIEGEGIMNLNLQFAEDALTRGWGETGAPADEDFADGVGDESKVRKVDVYYFTNNTEKDTEEKYLGKGTAQTILEGSGSKPNIEKTITAAVPATVVNALLNKPNTTVNIVVVLNGETFTPNLTANTSTFADFNAKFTPSDNATAGFMMTSSTYYPNNKETFFAEISQANIAEEGGNPTPVEVFVERVCSKVTLSAGESVTTPADVTFEAKGWGLNIRNNIFFPIKKFDESFTKLTVTNTDQSLVWPGADDWTNDNAVSKHRSYWACDPNYGTTDADFIKSTTDENFIKNTFAGLTTDLGKSEYCLENTMNYLEQRLPQTTTAVVYARYLPGKMTDGTTGSDPCDNGRKSWVLKDGLYYSLSTFVNNFLVSKGLYVIKAQTETETEYRSATATDVTFSYTKVTIKDKDNVVGATGYTFTKKEGTTLFTIENEVAKEFTDYTSLGEEFKSYASGASIYIDGYCYYEIPIRHFNDTELGALEEDWNGTYLQKHLGRYGIVRNHAYQLTINSVNKPGKPITGGEIIPDDDPDDDTKKYNMIVTINVLSWAVRNQGVEL